MKRFMALLMVSILLTGCASSDSTDKMNGKQSKSAIAFKDDKKNDEKENEKNTKKEKKEKEGKTGTRSSDNQSKSDGTMSKAKTNTTKSDTGKSSSKKKDPVKPNTNNSTSGADQPSKPSEPSKPADTPPNVEEPTPDPPANQQAKADQVFAQINAYRVQNGKEPFTYSAELRSRCDSHAFNMAQREALWHSGNGAECITNYDDPFTAWINSPPHKEILMCNNTQAAVGIYYYNGYYYSVFQTRW